MLDPPSVIDGPPTTSDDPLIATLLRLGVRPEQLEASVRHEGDGRLRGDRMMIERASRDVVEVVLASLGLGPGALGARLLGLAASAALPMIVGWDRGRAVAKLYLNASDAARSERLALAGSLGLTLSDELAAPHVVGVNVGAAGDEIKVYVQHEDAVALAAPLGDAARALASHVAARGLSAGGVASWDVTGTAASPRAFFVALRAGAPLDVLAALPGWDPAAFARALPRPLASLTSVGVPVASLARWTAYGFAHPDDSRWGLEPAACFRAASAEVGVFVAPNDASALGPRAYARTARHLLSYRVRRGAPPPERIKALMAWALGAVARAEREGSPVTLADPPSPWECVRG
jgi:hypothetical protein